MNWPQGDEKLCPREAPAIPKLTNQVSEEEL